MNIIEYYDYLLLLPYIFIFFLLARRFVIKHAETSREVYWLLISWWIKVVACVLYAWMIVYYYGYGDPLGYKDRSDEVLRSILRDWHNVKYVFLPVEHFRNYISSFGYSNHIFNTVEFAYYTESNFIISRVSCVAAFFTFNRFLIISFVFTNIAYYGFVVMYTTFKKIIHGYNKELAIACLFIPSCLFWSSGLAKEPVCVIALGLIFSSAVQLFFEKKTRIIVILKLIGFSYVLLTTKNYIFFCFLVAFVLWLFYNFLKWLVAKSILFKIYFGLMIIMLMALISRYVSYVEGVITDNLGGIISSNIDMYESMAAAKEGGGSLIDVKNLDVSNVSGILKFIPQGLVNVLFRPFPWEISNVLMVFTVFENLFFIVLFFKVLMKTRLFTRNLFINKNYQVFAIIFSITLAFAIGMSTFNFGSMVRYKMPFLPFWGSFLLIINKKLSSNKAVVDV